MVCMYTSSVYVLVTLYFDDDRERCRIEKKGAMEICLTSRQK